MTFRLEYHILVKCRIQRSFPVSLALLGILLLPLLLVSTSPAQSHSDSATSSGSSSGSGHSSSGSSPSFTSSGPGSHVTANSGVTFSTNNPHSTSGSGHNEGHPHHRSAGGDVYYPYLYAVPVPYPVDATDADTSDDADDDAEYQGGPTVFDRRGSGAASYVPTVDSGPAHLRPADAQTEHAPADSTFPEPTPDPTGLVFKDGHQLEIRNYAVVSQTLYDLTPGHARKIALADLDLPATEKLNDDRGVTFELPPSAQAN